MELSTASSITERLQQSVATHCQTLLGLSAALHADPETAFNEHRSVARVAAPLEQAGFSVQVGGFGLETSLRAVFGTGSLTVGICAEYDALPEIGHACGHNIIASSAVGAALALAEVAEDLDLRVVLLGTPAEEDGGGKELMLRAGAFDDVDFAIMVHPTPGVDIDCTGTSSQGCDRFTVHFTGTASHAAAAPSHGVNASNAATIAQVAIGLLRQQLPDGIRINAVVLPHRAVTNVIQAQASLEIEVRAHDAALQQEIKDKVLRACHGAALASGCEMAWKQSCPVYLPVLQHEQILVHWNNSLRATGRNLIQLPAGSAGGGSTDMGNVSQYLPAIHPVIAVLDAVGMPHTAEFAAETCTAGADQAVLDAAVALAGTATAVAADQQLRSQLQLARAQRAPHTGVPESSMTE